MSGHAIRFEQGDLAMPTPPSVLNSSHIRARLGLSRERMARLMNVSAKTIQRWEEGGALPASADLRDRLARLEEIAELGTTVYTADGFARFLITPVPTFGGR